MIGPKVSCYATDGLLPYIVPWTIYVWKFLMSTQFMYTQQVMAAIDSLTLPQMISKNGISGYVASEIVLLVNVTQLHVAVIA